MKWFNTYIKTSYGDRKKYCTSYFQCLLQPLAMVTQYPVFWQVNNTYSLVMNDVLLISKWVSSDQRTHMQLYSQGFKCYIVWWNSVHNKWDTGWYLNLNNNMSCYRRDICQPSVYKQNPTKIQKILFIQTEW